MTVRDASVQRLTTEVVVAELMRALDDYGEGDEASAAGAGRPPAGAGWSLRTWERAEAAEAQGRPPLEPERP